ncbi:RHS repeat-associated core domain-containing protein [Salibacter halophilus]|uniref:RHS repeat-associated core domain-containing protein n=1 Tax=Salibacter halophilus TaxID=1803916 RepID=A0A6N6MBE1_9FLAO|nr:RHS repeat-associated core domain-containing protein [Salibacter halophilus]KAB1065893.1 hypothetical protein F3059_00020 [Salibacter halophilus]
MKLLYKLTLIIVFSTLSLSVYPQVISEKLLTNSGGLPTVSFSVSDPSSLANSYNQIIDNYQKIKVELATDVGFVTPGSGSWNASVFIEIKDNGGNVVKSGTLNIGGVVNRTKSVIEYEVSSYGSYSVEFSNISKNNFSQKAIVKVFKEDNFEISGKDSFTNSKIELVGLNASCVNNHNGACNRINLKWDDFNYSDPSVGLNTKYHFEKYEVEIIKAEPGIESDGNGGYNIIWDYNWKNATRVILDDNQYSFTPIDGRGLYAWRVRGIGNKFDEEERINNYSDWTGGGDIANDVQGASTHFTLNTSGSPSLTLTYNSSLSSYSLGSGSQSSGYFFIDAAFDDDVNWKYKKVNVEHGKSSESITYANGLNQPIQKQSRISSGNYVMKQESAYDHMGRPSLSVLPSPVEQHYLGYDGSVATKNGNPLTAQDFDTDANTFNPLTIDNTSAAREYYSDNNVDQLSSEVIPEAENVVSRTVYKNDPSGRVYKKSTPGKNLEINNSLDPLDNHNTTNIYGTPAQSELDRLFGSEAPLAKNTYKVLSIDPNGVRTMKYYSKSGKMLASFLDNDVVLDNLLGVGGNNFLDIYGSLPESANSGQENFSSTNIVVSGGQSAEINGNNVDKVTPVTLNYSFTPASFGVECNGCSDCGYCYSCSYKVDISVRSVEFPDDPDRNATLSFVVGPFDNCGDITQLNSFGAIGNLAALNNSVVTSVDGANWLFNPDGSVNNSIHFSELSQLSGIAPSPKVYLPMGSYVIERKVKVFNGDGVLEDAIQDLTTSFEEMTPDDNCCGPFTPDEFSCPDEGSFTCDGDNYAQQLDDLTQMVIDIADKEQNYLLDNGNDYTDYLEIAPGDLTSYNLLQSGGFNDVNDWLDFLICDKGMTPSEIMSCILAYEEMLNGNIQKVEMLSQGTGGSATGPSTPAPSPNQHLDVMKNFFDCIGSDPYGKVCGNYFDIVQYTPGGNSPEEQNAIAVMQNDPFAKIIYYHDGAITSYSLPAPLTPYSSQINQVSVSVNSTSTTDQSEIKNWQCINTNLYPSAVQTSGTEAEIRKELAKNACDCLKGLNDPPSVPTIDGSQSTTSAIDEMIEKCEEACEAKRLSYEMAINNEEQAVNLETNPNLYGPEANGWNDIFSPEERECIENNLALTCLEGCQMEVIKKVAELEEKNCTNCGSGGSNCTTDFCDLVDNCPNCPGGLTVDCVSDAASNSCITDEVINEQEAYKRSLLYTPKIKRVANPPSVPEYSQAGEVDVVQDDIINFIHSSWNEELKGSYRQANSMLLANYPGGGGNPFDPRIHPNASYGSNLRFVQQTDDYFYDLEGVNSGYYANLTVVTSVIYDPGSDPNDFSDDQITEINFAFHCDNASTNWNSDHKVSWSFLPDPNVTCPIFSNGSLTENVTQTALVDLYFDDYQIMHAVPKVNGFCKDHPSWYYYQNLSDNDNMLKATVNVGSGSTGQSLQLEMGQETQVNSNTVLTNLNYITDNAVSWQTSGFEQDIVDEINQTWSTPNVFAEHAGGSSVDIVVKARSSDDFSGTTWKLLKSGNVPATIGNNGEFEVVNYYYNLPYLLGDLAPVCDLTYIDDIPLGDCPYGYDLVEGDYHGSELTPSNLSEFNDKVSDFWKDALEDLVINRPFHRNVCSTSTTERGYETVREVDLFRKDQNFLINGAYYRAIVEVYGMTHDQIDVSTGNSISPVGFISKTIEGIRFRLECKEEREPIVDYFLGDSACTQYSSFPYSSGPLTISGNSSGSPFPMQFNGWEYFFDDIRLDPVNDFHVVFEVNQSNINQLNSPSSFFYNQSQGSNPNGLGWYTIVDEEHYGWGDDLSDFVDGDSPCNSVNACEICLRWEFKDPDEKEPLPEVEPITCEDDLANYVANQTFDYLSSCLETKKQALIASYNNDCIANMDDNLSYTYQVNYDGYTLYYYDRAGNLISTVPPEGVNTLNQSQINQAQDYRQNGLNPVFPQHDNVTEYRYNSLKQVVWQKTPDGGVTEFIYNYKKKLRMSQNAQQKIDNKASFTIYDYLDRVIASGEVEFSSVNNFRTYYKPLVENDSYYPYTGSSLNSLANGVASVNNVTKTFYGTDNTVQVTDPASSGLGTITLENVRNRIWKTESIDQIDPNHPVKTYYSYDIQGNVKLLIKDIYPLGFRTIEYEYDQISGNVNMVKVNNYGGNIGDESFFYKYEYDADNRITNVQTSLNGEVWDEDASYEYYKHGPLFRKQLGEYSVQGNDNAYTVHGWLKSMNHSLFQNDPGRDGFYAAKFKVDEITQPGPSISSMNFKVYGIGNVDAISSTLYLDELDSVDIATEIVEQINSIGNAGDGLWASNNGGTSNIITVYTKTMAVYDGGTYSNFNITPLSLFEKNHSAAPDEYAMELGYYNGDYQREGSNIGGYYTSGGSPVNASDQMPVFNQSGSPWEDKFDNLYNGNIRYWVSNTRAGQNTGGSNYAIGAKLNMYSYDYWNRIRSNTLQELDLQATSHYSNTGVFDSDYGYDLNGNLQELSRSDGQGNTFDELEYNYSDPASLNKLTSVEDNATASAGDDFPSSTTANYDYDAIGNLIHDSGENLDIEWNPNGKIKRVILNNRGITLEFRYDASGNRIMKIVSDAGRIIKTIYLRDAQGNVLMVYKYEEDIRKGIHNISLNEVNIYGSSREGNYLADEETCINCALPDPVSKNTPSVYSNTYGRKQYEISDHLGNVRTVVTDRKQQAAGRWYKNHHFDHNQSHGWSSNNGAVFQNGRMELLNGGDLSTKAFSSLSTGNYAVAYRVVSGQVKISTNLLISQTTSSGSYLTSDGFMGPQNWSITFENVGSTPAYVDDIQIVKVGSDKLKAEVVSWQDYYPFGMMQPGRVYNSPEYRYGFNGMERDDEIKGSGNSLDFGARIYDPRIGRWLSTDPAQQDYPFASPYNFVLNTPIQAIDPDGKRVYFVGGAGNDQDGWNYKQRFNDIWESKGIQDVRTMSATHGKMGDILFTHEFKNFSKGMFDKVTSDMIQATANAIVEDLAANPLGEGEQLNLAGYSYGSVLQAHVAIELADRGVQVDNLSLVGSPISDESSLMETLKEYQADGKIGGIQRIDIEGDKLSNPSNEFEYYEGAYDSSPIGEGDDAPHFDLARPGKEADKKIGEAADKLKSEGVK